MDEFVSEVNQDFNTILTTETFSKAVEIFFTDGKPEVEEELTEAGGKFLIDQNSTMAPPHHHRLRLRHWLLCQRRNSAHLLAFEVEQPHLCSGNGSTRFVLPQLRSAFYHTYDVSRAWSPS